MNSIAVNAHNAFAHNARAALLLLQQNPPNQNTLHNYKVAV